MSGLPRHLHWTVYLDNFYTTLLLLGRLRRDFQIGGCGTARPHSAGFPAEFKIPKPDVGKYDYHLKKIKVIKNEFTLNQDVAVLLWFDNAPVTMMTTVHPSDAEVVRDRKRPGKKSKNAKRSREAFGNEYHKELPIPLCFDEYNHYMGGVDIADQMRNCYDTQLTFRTWWPMFF